MEKVLVANGIGQAWGDVLDSGLLLAAAYFEKHGLDFLKCYEAYENNEKPEVYVRVYFIK